MLYNSEKNFSMLCGTTYNPEAVLLIVISAKIPDSV
jgi:hypothetical protein